MKKQTKHKTEKQITNDAVKNNNFFLIFFSPVSFYFLKVREEAACTQGGLDCVLKDINEVEDTILSNSVDT